MGVTDSSGQHESDDEQCHPRGRGKDRSPTLGKLRPVNNLKSVGSVVAIVVFLFGSTFAGSVGVATATSSGTFDAPVHTNSHSSTGEMANSQNKLQDSPTGLTQEQECNKPTKKRRRAKEMQKDLKSLDDGLVPDYVLTDVNNRIKQGDLNWNRNQFCEARKAYQNVIDIAKPVLRSGYRKASERRLDETEAMIEAELADGNPDPDAGDLKQRVSQLRQELNQANSTRRLGQIYDNTKGLKAETRDKLPTGTLEKSFEAAREGSVFFWSTILLIGVVIAETVYLFSSNEGGRIGRRS